MTPAILKHKTVLDGGTVEITITGKLDREIFHDLVESLVVATEELHDEVERKFDSMEETHAPEYSKPLPEGFYAMSVEEFRAFMNTIDSRPEPETTTKTPRDPRDVQIEQIFAELEALRVAIHHIQALNMKVGRRMT